MRTLKKWARGGIYTVATTWALAGAIATAAENGTPDAANPPHDEVPFRIDAQPIEGALREFATQAHLQLIYETTNTGLNLQSSHVSGEFTPEVALNRLLAHTNLNYKFINDRTVSVRAADGTSPVHARTEGELLRLAGRDSADVANGLGQQPDGTDVSADSSGRYAARRKDMEEVVVTSQKREERVFDVPISVAVLGSDELKNRDINTLEDLSAAVPNLSYVKTGNNVNFEIRGVSNASGSAPLVGVYIDEADVTLGGAAATEINPVVYDLDRVEVLRGPQGTLYGEGSAGGTIRFITKNPNLKKFEFDSQVAAQFTEGGGPSQRINAVVNVPVIENELGLRIAGTYAHDGGWIDQPVAGEKHINWQDLTNVRIKGLWQPDSHFTVSAMAIINRNDRSMDYSDPNSPTVWTQVFNLSTTPRLRNDYDLYNLTMTYEFSFAQILNTTSYLKQEAPMWNNGYSIQLTPPGTPAFDSYAPYTQIVDHLLTDELRLTSIGSGPWQWTLGGFYRHHRDSANIPADYFDLPGAPGDPLPQPFGIGLNTLYKSWSAFGDVSYKVWDRFTVGAGIRYFSESQDFADLIQLTDQTGRFHSLDPRAYAQFKVTPNINVYASAAKGFRSGGFNGLGQPPFDPESVKTFELGTKMALLDDRVAFDSAVFWSDYSDYQTYGFAPGSSNSYYSNAGKARIKGVEWSVTWRPMSQWRFDVRGDYVNGRFTEINATSTAYDVGDPLDLVPRYQVSASGQYDFSWVGKPGFLRLDYSQQGPQTFRNRNANGPSPWYLGESDVIELLNFRASLLLKENLKLGFSAQNLLNDDGFVNPYNLLAIGVRSRPRTYGVDFSVSFD